jgi:hypothetical protein
MKFEPCLTTIGIVEKTVVSVVDKNTVIELITGTHILNAYKFV